MSEPGGERVEVWRQPDGLWRWRYRNPDNGVDLLSNESHITRDQAEHAAAVAYPSVPIVPGSSLATGLGLGQTVRRAGLGALAAAAVTAVAPVAAGLAWRRWRPRTK
jgi:hypothetical protein